MEWRTQHPDLQVRQLKSLARLDSAVLLRTMPGPDQPSRDPSAAMLGWAINGMVSG